MSLCYEVAIFDVAESNIARVIEVSLLLFKEINADAELIVDYKILQKTNAAEQLCWQLTWRDQEAVKFVAERWSSYPSTPALEALVGEKHYYGHFSSLI